MEYRSDILEGRFEFRENGTFRVLSKFAAMKVIISAVLCAFSIYILLMTAYSGLLGAFNTMSEIILRLVIGTAMPIIFVWYILYVFGGEKQYRYEANNKVMRIFNKKHTYIFKYDDVRYVKYAPLRLLWKRLGYTATVGTKHGELSFRYIVPNKADLWNTESTPFNILKQPPAPIDDKTKIVR